MPNGTESDIYRFPEGFVPEDIAALFKPGLKTVNEMQNIVVKMTAIVDEAGRDISEEELALQKMAVGELANLPRRVCIRLWPHTAGIKPSLVCLWPGGLTSVVLNAAPKW
ncbi:hypothetical protein IE985_29980 [Klebsiella pneumoniae]|nr:hypothetical protein [Klebsiella pneumoniae]